jgi:site-specific recombinase XerD
MSEPTAIALRGKAYEAALRNAVALWAEATTAPTSLRRDELAHDKREATNSFFSFMGKHPSEITPLDVTEWRRELEARNLKPATVYARPSRLSSFFEWAMRDPALGQVINNNPVRLARPKAPKALILKYRRKGGKYGAREVLDTEAVSAVIEYLTASDRLNVLQSNRTLWTRHDRTGRAGAPLSSHSFVKNLKAYTDEVGIKHIHLHQTYVR